MKQKPNKGRGKGKPLVKTSDFLWTRGVDERIDELDYLLGDRPKGPRGGGLFGDRPKPPRGGGLFGDRPKPPRGGGLFGLGYIPDRPDGRDFDVHRLAETAGGKSFVAGFCKHEGHGKYVQVPKAMDLRKLGDFRAVSHQGATQSCTAHAVTAMVEYHLSLQPRVGRELSRLFLYKVARELIGIEGDRGCTMRDTLKAISKWGCLEEVDWPFDVPWLERLPRVGDLDQAMEGPARGMGYCRLDGYNLTGEKTLENVLHALADGFPVALGMSLYSSIDDMGSKALIPVPEKGERVIGAHAVLAVGYEASGGRGERKGTLTIRNSWGSEWGDRGHAHLPFEYVTQQHAVDFWTMYPAQQKKVAGTTAGRSR